MAVEPGGAQPLEKRLDAACRRLDAQLVDASARLLERRNRPGGGDRALVHHNDLVAGVLDVGEQVRRENQVDAFVVREVAHELEHLVTAFRVHAVGRLVEEEQIGIVHQGLRELDALLHAGRVGLDVAVAGLTQTNVEQDFVSTLHRVDAGQAGQLAAIRDEGDGIHAGNMGVALRHVADAGADLERRLRDVDAEDTHAAALGHDEPEQRLDHRALAGTIGPQQADRSGRKRRRHVAQREVLSVGDAHVLERDDGISLSHSFGYTAWWTEKVRLLELCREITHNAETAEPAEKDTEGFSARSACSAFNVVFLHKLCSGPSRALPASRARRRARA